MSATDPLAELLAERAAKDAAMGRQMTSASIALAITTAHPERVDAFADRLFGRRQTPQGAGSAADRTPARVEGDDHADATAPTPRPAVTSTQRSER